MSIARHHAEWLSLIEVSGPFVSIPVLTRVFPQGLIVHDPEKSRLLRQAFEEWDANAEAGPRTNPAISAAWIKFVLTNVLSLRDESILEHQAVPQSLQTTVGEYAELLRPNLVIAENSTSKPRLLIQTYPLGQDLDKSVAGKRWSASPGTRMMELLHNTGVRLGLVTNGQRWMLVDAPKAETTGFASWYSNLWLEEPVTLRAFASLLGAERFFAVANTDTLEAMLAESAGSQQEVTYQLGYQVRRAVEVIVQSIDRADQDHGRHLLEGVEPAVLYEAALTVMMRLVFLFCAEERRLLPIDSELFAVHYAASTMREQLRKTADDHGEEILERRHDAWNRLLACFRLVYGGCQHPNLRMPAYGGHLFDPDRFPFLEGRKAGTRWTNCEAEPLPVNNRTVLHLLEALQMLEVKMPGGEKAARRLSFRALDIEQIGHVYEGLLDHTAKRATEPMLGLAGGRDKEPEVPLSKLEELKAKDEAKLIEYLAEETGRSPKTLKKALAEELDLTTASRFEVECGSDKGLFNRVKLFAALIREDRRGYPVIIRNGSVFVTTGTDRRSSGTHYTPRSLTEPIVQYTLEPLVFSGPAEGSLKEDWQLRTPKELLDLKICDMACGSGAFLVQACRFLSERLIEAWKRAEKTHPGTPGITPEGEASKGAMGEALIPQDADERMAYAKRLVAQRCLYGVDINPLAAEMAKLSLWLLTLAKDKPFTFLDHSIRCGDSLLGIHGLSQLKAFSLDGTGQQYAFGEVSLDDIVDEAIAHRIAIEKSPAETTLDLDIKAQDLIAYESTIAFLKCAADLLVAAELKPGNANERLRYRHEAAIQLGDLRVQGRGENYARVASLAMGKRIAFHWPLEFPEVIVERGGFDVILGNPPFLGGLRLETAYGGDWRDLVVRHIGRNVRGGRGTADLCAYFVLRANQLISSVGMFGLITTNSITEGDTRTVGLGQLLKTSTEVIRAMPSLKWPGVANLSVALLWATRRTWSGSRSLDGNDVTAIDEFLAIPSDVSGVPHNLVKSGGHSFIGATVLGLGFTLTVEEGKELVTRNRINERVLFPYLIGEDINTRDDQSPSRWIINFSGMTLEQASEFRECFELVESRVKPERDKLNGKTPEGTRRAKNWWLYAQDANRLFRTISGMPRVLVRSSVSKHHVIAFIDVGFVPAHTVVVFAYSDNAAFATLQSSVHEVWSAQYSSKLETRLRYTPTSCFETFVFPETPASCGEIGGEYHFRRQRLATQTGEGLTKVYNRFHDSGEQSNAIQELRRLHVEMDRAVAIAYGWSDLDLGHGFFETKQGIRFSVSEGARRQILSRLLKLNHDCHAEEVAHGLHDKKPTTPRATKANVAAPKMVDIGLFAYPASDADRAICAAALAIVEASDGLSCMEHLDVLLLATHPDWCAAFLDDVDVKSLKRTVKAAPKTLVVAPNAAINWKQCRDHLEQRGAIRAVRGNTGQRLHLSDDAKGVAEVKASFPSGTEGVVRFALKAVERLMAFKRDDTAASDSQKAVILSIRPIEQALELVA